MDMWKYYGITHRDHGICNPLSTAKLEHLVRMLRLKEGAHVLDVASGKGEYLIRIAERYKATGIGVDMSEPWVAEAKEKLADRAIATEVRFLAMPAGEYTPEPGERFDAVSCLGASFVYGGYEGTLRALAGMTVPGGLVVSGEPFWHHAPPKEYVEAAGEEYLGFGSHADNVATARRLGLNLVYTVVSSREEWDGYQGLQWYAAEDYARENPADPDVPALLGRMRREQENYLRWERELLGWAVYVFRQGET
jgi:SAM-dependent methyltransferase